jgi:hypothetical protein
VFRIEGLSRTATDISSVMFECPVKAQQDRKTSGEAKQRQSSTGGSSVVRLDVKKVLELKDVDFNH